MSGSDLTSTYRSVRTRAVRRGRRSPTFPELTSIVEQLDPRCSDCQIDGRSLRALRVHDRFGRRVVRLTLTLVDADGEYVAGNLEWACFKCVEIREIATPSEAIELGTAIGAVWRRCLGLASVSPTSGQVQTG